MSFLHEIPKMFWQWTHEIQKCCGNALMFLQFFTKIGAKTVFRKGLEKEEKKCKAVFFAKKITFLFFRQFFFSLSPFRKASKETFPRSITN
jgi:hypothetical protein